MKVHYRDNADYPLFLEDVGFLMRELRNNSEYVTAYGSSFRNSFIIMDERIDDHILIYDVEVTSGHVHIVKIDIFKYLHKYPDKCFIYDGFYSKFRSDIECADDFLDRLLHQDSCKEKIAKARIKKYIRPLEYRKYIRYLSVGLSIVALPIFLISIFLILDIISNNN